MMGQQGGEDDLGGPGHVQARSPVHHVEGHAMERTQPPVVDQPAGDAVAEAKAAIVIDSQEYAPSRGRDDERSSIVDRRRQGLLAEDVAAPLDRRQHHLDVQMIGCRHRHHVDVVALQDLIEPSTRRDVGTQSSRQLDRSPLVNIADAREPGKRRRLYRGRMQRPDRPAADDRHGQARSLAHD